MPEETVHSDEELLKVAREAEQELAAEQQRKPVTGRRDMAQYYELGSGRADMDELPEEAQVAVAARMTAIGLRAIAMGAGDETTDPRMDMDMSEVFHDVANLAEAGSPDLGEAGAVATEWVNANPEKAAAAEEIGGQLMAGMEQPQAEGDGRNDMMRQDMGPRDWAVDRIGSAGNWGLGQIMDHPRRTVAAGLGVGALGAGGLAAGGIYGANQLMGDRRQDMMNRQDMMGRQDMAVPGYGALRGGFDRARGYAQRGMDYGAEGVMRGAGGVDAAGRHVGRHPMAYGAGAAGVGGAGLGAGGYMGYQGMQDDRMDMMPMRNDMMPMDRADMAGMYEMGPMDWARRGAGRVGGMFRRPTAQGVDYFDDFGGMPVPGPMQGGGAIGRAAQGGMDWARVHPALAGAAGAGALGVGAGGVYGASQLMGDRQDMAPFGGAMGRAREAAKGEIFKKIAAAAGIGGAAAAGAGAGAAGAAAASGNLPGQNRSDMMDGEHGRRNMSAMPAATQEEQRRIAMEALKDRDEVMKKAMSIAPDNDYSGKTSKEILDTLYARDPNLENLPEERLRGRLDMEIEKSSQAQAYLSSGSDAGQSLPETFDSGSIAMNLRRLAANSHN